MTGGDATITTLPMKNSGFVISSGGVIGNVNFLQEPDGVHCQNPAVRRFNFIVKRCRHTLQLKNFNFKSLESLSIHWKKRMGKSNKQKKKTPKKDGVNLGKRERKQIRRLVKILEGWLKEDKEKEKALQEATQARDIKEKKPEEDEKDDKEDEILDESSSSESSLESDTDDSDAPAVLHQQFSICFCAESRSNINNKNKTFLESFPLLYLAASKKKAAASKEVDVESLKNLALMSPIAPKPSKGKALVQPRCDEGKTVSTPVKITRKKLKFNHPLKELVKAAAKLTARRKSLRSSKDLEAIHLSDSAKQLFGDDLDELQSEKEEELLKETPVPVRASTQATTQAVATTA
ncbi:hypothetical protein DAPPUDRAFT_109778 [Daphnia pulex]|uniref:Uncharacterized protein n=1 Tax=Daphnia pulex TaxID=6669 RepID=E9H468_DAPPU|nr:hypothetical protein DAPPUDRAFT_109778 [Daphnia pulex]|eukprot:EFX73462.1 hypothetical protein DAPPUDRAFT_109778 [Daphnia pulex]